MSIYEEITGQLNLTEQHTYGSARIGMRTQRTDMLTASTPIHTGIKEIIRGERRYELTNHLLRSSLALRSEALEMRVPTHSGGNVLIVCSDQLTATDGDSNNLVDFNAAEVVSFSDYYPFGAPMADRTSGESRYGFNGKERDDEYSGDGNTHDFGARMYDGRLGRWWSVDGLFTEYPSIGVYTFAINTPIQALDPDGRLIIFINGLWGWPNKVGEGGTIDYWDASWVGRVQDAIGDHSIPIFLDGSLGGAQSVPLNNSVLVRQAAGKEAGYLMAPSIIASLQTNSDGEIVESVKFVTNSMGAAYERGFSEGLVNYIDQENFKRSIHNSIVESEKMRVLERFNAGEIDFVESSQLLNELDASKLKLLTVRLEMVVDLEPHQVSTPDPNCVDNYYMLCNYDDRNVGETITTRPQHVDGAARLGLNPDGTSRMTSHHSSGAIAEDFPPDTDGSD